MQRKFSTYYHPDVTAYMDEQIIDYTQIQEHALWQQENLKEIVFDFKDIIVEENKVAFHFQSSGLQDNRDIGYKVLAILMCQHLLGHIIKQLFELPRILQVINNH